MIEFIKNNYATVVICAALFLLTASLIQVIKYEMKLSVSKIVKIICLALLWPIALLCILAFAIVATGGGICDFIQKLFENPKKEKNIIIVDAEIDPSDLQQSVQDLLKKIQEEEEKKDDDKS